jgi:hypothetical protein
MPIVNSSGKFGQSMDCSQITDFRRRYATVKQQNSKPIPSDQSVKPRFNQDRLNASSQNGNADVYRVRGLTPVYSRFLAVRR